MTHERTVTGTLAKLPFRCRTAYPWFECSDQRYTHACTMRRADDRRHERRSDRAPSGADRACAHEPDLEFQLDRHEARAAVHRPARFFRAAHAVRHGAAV